MNNMYMCIGTYYWTSLCVQVAMQGINPALCVHLIILPECSFSNRVDLDLLSAHTRFYGK